MILNTVFFADSIGEVIAVLIPFHTLVAVDLMLLKILDTVDFTELNVDEMELEIFWIVEEIDDFILFQILDIVVRIEFSVFDRKFFALFHEL